VSTRSRTPFVIAAVLVVGAGAAVLAIVLTRSSDDDNGASPATTSPTTDGGGEDIVYGTVTVEGEPLPEYEGEPDPAVGMTPPTLIGQSYDGTPLEIVPGEGGPMMVVFLAHWCPHCNAEVPVLLEWRDSGDIPEELQIFGVSTAVTDTRPNFPPSEWLADAGWDWPTLADDEQITAFQAFGGPSFPYFVVIGADGTVKARNRGELPIEALNELVETALA